MSLLEIKNISKNFMVESGLFRKMTGAVRALDNVSLKLDTGAVLGIVGESGSGKTTLGRIICRLITPDNGSIIIDGKNIDDYSRLELAGKVQMVFQDPFASLNPKLTIGTMLYEAAGVADKERCGERVQEILAAVGLKENVLGSYPHQFSGGQRQRIALARALVRKPQLIIADEPLSSLDISTQNQMLNLFVELKQKYALAFVFISHDLVTASNLADYLIVMKEGRVIEQGVTAEVLSSPKQDYTKNLLSAVPMIE
jgi:ABC-type oligopeptide transport system ATPase subunit